MTELGDLAAPIMRAATRLHGHRARRQRCQERQKLAAAQLLAKDHRARTVSPMELIVRTGPDGTLHLTCPELPQLSVSSPTVTEAISRTEDTINAILAGRVGGFSGTEPKGA